jgi:hypothetical protein
MTGNQGFDPSSLSPKDAELTPEGIEKMPSVPAVGDVTITGTITPSKNWSTFKIPVEPTTQSLKVSVSHDLTNTDAEIPALDQLYLVGPTGIMLAQLTGASANWQGPRQEVNVGLAGVPKGANLVVRIIESSTAPSPDEATAPAPVAPAEGAVPFTMEVKRGDVASDGLPAAVFSQTIALNPSNSLLIGYGSIFAVIAPWAVSSGSSASILDEAEPNPSDSLRESAATTKGASLAEQTVAEAPGVSVGPLVSLGSAPIGPLLGTTTGDPTPSIDRNERAYDLVGSDSGAGAVVAREPRAGLAARIEDALTEGVPRWQPDDQGGGSESFVQLRGPGAMPVLTWSVKGVRAAGDPTELLATLPPAAAPILAADQMAAAPLHAPGEDSRRDPRAEKAILPDYLSTACGLVLGLSLTAGPLYPDLMALVRTRLPWRASGPCQPRAPHGSSGRSLRSWARWLSLLRV